jgi:ATP-dependent DNA helicase RecG
MIGYCNQNGTPEPEFQEYSGGFSVVFRFKEPMGGSIDKTLPEHDLQKLTPRQKAIFNILLAGGEMSLIDIAHQLQDEPASRTMRKDLGRLKSLGFIDLKGWGRSSKWFLVK